MKQKLLFVTPNMERGGMQRVVSLILNYAATNGREVHILCLKDNVVEYTLHDKIAITTPPYLYKQGVVNKLKTFKFLIKNLKRIRPDVVLSCNEVYNPLVVLACKLTRTKVYISDRSNPYKELRKTVQTFRKLCYPLADGMIAQTDIAKELFIKRNYNNNIIVIPNPLREINDNYDRMKKHVIVSVGRLVHTKRFCNLIEIFSSIDISKEWELHILGDGPEKENLSGLIKSLNVSDIVKLNGQVSDVDYYLSKASIFAFTSISEGFPNALSEAVAFPLPVIAYDCPAGPSDIIMDEENGYLIPMYDRQQYKDKLEKMMLSRELRNKMTLGFESHRNKYAKEKIILRFLSFLEI